MALGGLPVPCGTVISTFSYSAHGGPLSSQGLSGEAEDSVLEVALARRMAGLQAWLLALRMPAGLGGALAPLWLVIRQLVGI